MSVNILDGNHIKLVASVFYFVKKGQQFISLSYFFFQNIKF